METCMLCRGGNGESHELVVDNLNPCIKKLDGSSSVSEVFSQFEEWAEHCVNSVCRLLKIPKHHPLKTSLMNASYCSSCTQLIRDIDLTLKHLDRLQSDLVNYRDTFAAKVRSNYQRIPNVEDITVQYDDLGSGSIVPCKQEVFMFDEVVKLIHEKTEQERTRWTTSDFMRHECLKFSFKEKSNAKATSFKKKYHSVVHIKEEIDTYEEDDFDVMAEIPDIIIPQVSTLCNKDREARRKVSYAKKYNEEDDWSDEGPDSPVSDFEASETLEDREGYIDPDWSDEISPHASSRSEKISWESKTRNQPKNLIQCTQKECNLEFQNRKSLLSHVRQIHEELSIDLDNSASNSDEDSWDGSKSGAEEKSKDVAKKATKKKYKRINKEPFPCSEEDCKKTFRNEQRMMAHIRKIHRGDPTPYHCTNCDLKYEARDKLDWHNRTTHGVRDDSKKTFPCTESTCTKVFCSSYALIIHQREIHEGETHPFHCDECEEKFQSENILRYHKLKHKAKKGGASCTVCNKNFTTVSGMKSHMKRAHPTGQDICKKCSFCGISKASDEELEHHEAEHKKREVPFSCLECDLYFTSSTDLTRHMVIHDDTRWMCDICGLLLMTERNLRSHRLSHDESFTKFQCQECGLKCASKAVLQRHSARHTNERKHVCDQCGKSFKYSSALLVHTRRHNNINPFICKICGKGFIASHYMKKHEQIHSGILAYECKVCGKRFRAQSNLYQHERTHGPHNPNKKPRARKSKPVQTEDGSSSGTQMILD